MRSEKVAHLVFLAAKPLQIAPRYFVHGVFHGQQSASECPLALIIQYG